MAGWCSGANMKPNPSVSIDSAIRSGACSRSNPSASSTSAEPETELTARLPCFATAAPAAAATIAAVVEMLNVRAPSPPVPTTSTTSVRAGCTGSTWARIASAHPAISSALSPFARRATRKPPIWAGVASPAMISPITSRAWSRPRSWPSRSVWIAAWITVRECLCTALDQPLEVRLVVVRPDRDPQERRVLPVVDRDLDTMLLVQAARAERPGAASSP